MNLDEIGLKHATDKASNGHNYLHFYERLFASYQNTPTSLLEIGAQFGLSLRTWREYFTHPASRIQSVEIASGNPGLESFHVHFGNAYSEEMLLRINRQQDIIIDDGSHDADDIRWFLQHYWPLLAPGGIMIVEDCRMSWTTYCVHNALPPGWQWNIVDFTTSSPLPDSTLILAWKPLNESLELLNQERASREAEKIAATSESPSPPCPCPSSVSAEP